MSLVFRLIVALALWSVGASVGSARPPHKQAAVTYYGSFLSERLKNCNLCHLPDRSSSESKPHNPFGARLQALGLEWEQAGQSTDMTRRLEQIADEDADNDGVPNLLEILSGHFPGDPSDKPSLEDVSRAKQTLTEFRKSLSGYPWRPFEKVQRPEVPVVRNSSWVRTPIDRFIAAEHERLGLTPRPEADRATLLRRVHMDLIGLAPTREELHEFLNDTSANAYEKVVDRLLASPRYGERWGRHWMDVWRYSDWAGWEGGGQIRDSQPHIWRWRDWIIESLNQDKGYDQMIVEMFAGDEIAPNDPATLRATGYLVRNYKMLSREKWLQDTVDHTFMAFQGVTIGCAKCHDHMYDPILQKEYYQVRAIFTPHQVRIDRIPGQPDTKKDGLVRVYDADLTAPTFLLIRGDDRTPDKTPLAPAVPKMFGGSFQPEAVSLPREAHSPDKRDFVIRETVAASEEKWRQAESTRQARFQAATPIVAGTIFGFDRPVSWFARVRKQAEWHHRLEDLRVATLEADLTHAQHEALLAVLAVEKLEDEGRKETNEWKAAATQALAKQRLAAVAEARWNVHQALRARERATDKPMIEATDKKLAESRSALAKAESDLKAPLSTAYTPRNQAKYPESSTGRRLAFARWLAHTNNPLTARVAVNHIWLRHFGQALVPSVFDFGRNGRAPTHPALLDWMAAEFMHPSVAGEKPWSMKYLHRLIVTSAVYRQASTPEAENLRKDQDNIYYWRMAPRRLEAELVRDNLLHVAGRLDLAMSGPDIDHNLGLKVFRRSLYFRHAAEKQMEFLKLFDAASVTECYQRKDSIIPQQALALVNSEMAIRMGRSLARSLAARYPHQRDFITAAFEQILTRPPTSAELAECQAFLAEQSQQVEASATIAATDELKPAAHPGLRARELLTIVLLNHHEFVTVR